MDLAALGLSVDSSGVVKGTTDLDKFSASADNADKSMERAGGSVSKMIAIMKSMDAKLGTLITGLAEANSSLSYLTKVTETSVTAQAKLVTNMDQSAIATTAAAEAAKEAAKAQSDTAKAAETAAKAQKDYTDSVAGAAAAQVKLSEAAADAAKEQEKASEGAGVAASAGSSAADAAKNLASEHVKGAIAARANGDAMGGAARQASAFRLEVLALVRVYMTVIIVIGAVLAILAAVVVALAVGAVAWLNYSNAVYKFERIAQGAGRVIGVTGTQLEDMSQAAARAGDMSVGAARDIITEYVKMGGVTASVLTDLTALTKDFAAATGQDAAGGARELGKAFQDPIQGAEELAVKYGAVSQAAIEQISKMVEQNDLAGAQAILLKQLEPAFDGASERANVFARAWDGIAVAASNAWTSMGKAIDRMLTGGDIANKISALEKQRAAGPTLGQWAMGGGTSAFNANIDKQLADLRYQRDQAEAMARNAASNSARQRGASVVQDYQGGGALAGYQRSAGALRGALATDLDPATRKQTTEALAAYTHAIDTFIPKQEKALKLAALDAQIAKTRAPAAKAALVTQREQLARAGEVITTENALALARSKGETARARATKSGDKRAETLAREIAANDAMITSLNKLADAYGVSDASALKAEITAKATSAAIKKQADVSSYVAQQIRLAVAERTVDAAKEMNTTRVQTDALAALNAQVSSGTMTVEQANLALAEEARLRPYLAAYALAEGDAKERLAGIIAKLRGEMERANKEAVRSQELAQLEKMKERAAQLDVEAQAQRNLGQARVDAMMQFDGDRLEDELARINLEYEKSLNLQMALLEAERLRKLGQNDLAQATLKAAEQQNRLLDQKEGFAVLEDGIRRVKDQTNMGANAIGDMFTRMLTGAASVKQSIKDLILELLRMQMMKSFTSLFGSGGALGGIGKVIGGLLKANANGGVYSSPGLSAYSSSVVSQPTVFPFAKGMGLMGEAGPEAIMPLKRGPDGKLGVSAASNANDNGRLHVSVSIDDSGNLRALVRDEAGAVVAESAPSIVGQSVQATRRSINKSKAGWGIR